MIETGSIMQTILLYALIGLFLFVLLYAFYVIFDTFKTLFEMISIENKLKRLRK